MLFFYFNRTAIDDNLFEDEERAWRLFREIVEGLFHIHQQGMIHRDLKRMLSIQFAKGLKIKSFEIDLCVYCFQP